MNILFAMATVCLPLVTAYAVIDGDTLSYDGGKIRLSGIDAPELKQACIRDGTQYLCGQEASRALQILISKSRGMTCTITGTDRYKRSLATCAIVVEKTLIDLGHYMVSNGYAMAYRKYSSEYVNEEADARKAKLGIWAGSFQAPWEWRALQKAKGKKGKLVVYEH